MTSEVLPAIRKQGGYMVARTDESDEVIMARALPIMQDTIERRTSEKMKAAVAMIQTADLYGALLTLGYKGNERVLTRSQVRTIVQHLGEL